MNDALRICAVCFSREEVKPHGPVLLCLNCRIDRDKANDVDLYEWMREMAVYYSDDKLLEIFR